MRKLAFFAGGFCSAALAFAGGIDSHVAILLCAAASLKGVVLVFWRQGRWLRVALALAGLGAGFGWCALDWQMNVQPLTLLDGAERSITAEALASAQTTDYGMTADVLVTLDGERRTATLYGDETLSLSPGDMVRGVARIRTVQAPSRFGARDIALYLYLGEDAVVSEAASPGLRHWPVRFSESLRETLRQLLPGECGAYVVALLTGDGSGLSDAFYNQLSLSGTRHIVAVSGMHIGILAGMLMLLMGRNRRLGALLGIPLIWFAAMAVGMTYSVTRAAIMQSLLLLAPVLRRENDTPTSLMTALMLILLPNPRAIMDVGLQLSFASVTGILLFSDHVFQTMWNNRLVLLCRGKSRLLSGAIKTVLASAAAGVSVIPTTLPLNLLYFELFSLAAPLSSALIVPVISWCFSGGILAGLAGMLWMPLGAVLALPLSWLLWYCMTMTRWIASIPFAAISDQSAYLWLFLIGFYLVVLYLLAFRVRCSLLIVGGCLLGLFSLCLLLSSLEYDRAGLSVTMLDVGQGQCVYFEAGGVSAMYDCGGEGDPGETAARFLQDLGRGGLDFLVLSHYDEDHVGGVAQLLSRVSVETLYLPALPDENGMQAVVLAAAEAHGCRTVFVEEDLAVSFGGGWAYLFAPVSDDSDNDGSVAACWSVDGFEVLLTGDMGVTAEKRLLYTHTLPEIEVIAAGHHGAAGATGTALLNTLSPEIALVSVGADNSYGHPAPETLQRLLEAGVSVYRTDQCGNITVR